MSEPAAVSPATRLPPPPPPARRRRRWVLRTLLALLLLLGVAAIVVELVLRSDVPRRQVVQALRDATGLNIQMASFRTNWGGRAVMRDLTAALPLEEQPLLIASEVRVTHTAILKLLFTRALDLEAVELRQPRLTLRQDALGVWNAARAAELISQAQDGGSDHGGRGGGVDLPWIDMRGATVEVLAAEMEPLVVAPVTVQGRPTGPREWSFQLHAGSLIEVQGQVLTGQDWAHQLRFAIRDADPLLRRWVRQAPSPLSATGSWRGRKVAGGAAGLLHLEEARGGPLHAAGDVKLQAHEQRLSLEPQALTLSVGGAPPMTVVLKEGLVSLTGQQMAAERLRVNWMGAGGELGALWRLEQRRGEVRLAWRGSVEPLVTYEGQLDATLALPADGRMTLEATVATQGQAPPGRWDAQVRTRVHGRSWKTLVASLEAPHLVLHREEEKIDLNGAAAEVALDWPVVRLTRLHLPHAAAAGGDGEVNVDSRSWRLRLAMEQWTPPLARGGPVDVNVEGTGGPGSTDVAKLEVRSGNVHLRASGSYQPDRPVPLEARGTFALDDIAPAQPQGLALHGRWHSDLHVSGTFEPRSIAVHGEVRGEALTLGEHEVEPLRVEWGALVEPARTTFSTQAFTFLGGRWSARGGVDTDARTAQFSAACQELPLERVTALLDWPLELRGSLAVKVESDVQAWDRDAVEVVGQWEVQEFGAPRVAAETGRGRLHARGGVVRLEDIYLRRGAGYAEGRIDFNVQQRERLHVKLKTNRWPVQTPEDVPVMLLDAQAELDVNVVAASAIGELSLLARPLARGEPVGELNLIGRMAGRRFIVQQLEGDLCQGQLKGQGTIVLDDWLQSTGELTWSDLDLATLGTYTVQVEQLAGVSSGRLTAERATSPRAPEPMLLRLRVQNRDGRYRVMDVGGAALTAYAGPQRVVLDNSTLWLAGGRAELWGRLRRREQPSAHLRVSVHNLDLDQLVHALAPEADPMPGRLSGEVSAIGHLGKPRRAAGEATLRLKDSDLAGSDIIGTLYNAMNLRFTPGGEPRGEGEARLRLDGDAIHLERLDYFNRGVQVIATGRLEDIDLGVDSPIDVHAAGTARPFRDVKLPLVGRLDPLLSALQARTTAVEAGGTLREPEVRVILLPEIGESLRRMLSGE